MEVGACWNTAPTSKNDSIGNEREKSRKRIGEDDDFGGRIDPPPSSSLKSFNSSSPKAGVSCALTNIRSIGPKSVSGASKRSELSVLCSKYQIDLVFITESWASEEDDNSAINLPGYKILSRVDKDTVACRGGGILIYVNERIKMFILLKNKKVTQNSPYKFQPYQ